MHVASRASMAEAPGCHAGEFELYLKVMGTQMGFKQESEWPGQAFFCLAWSCPLKPPDRRGSPWLGSGLGVRLTVGLRASPSLLLGKPAGHEARILMGLWVAWGVLAWPKLAEPLVLLKIVLK